MNRLIRRSATATIGAACATVLLGVGAASAHIDADPAAVEAGTVATVSFAVEHGCNGSNTTQLEFKAPDGVTDATAVDKSGWTTSAAGGTVTFAAGNLDASTPDTFSITFTAPTTPGTIYFPVVQTCAAGETAWIELPVDGGAEPEHPAPAVLVTDGPPTDDQLAPAHDNAGSTDATAAGSASSAVVVTSATVDTSAAPVAATTASSPNDASGNTGVVVGIVVGAVVVIGGAVLIANRRRGSSPG